MQPATDSSLPPIKFDRAAAIWWTINVITNLPVCLFLGWDCTSRQGRWGMFAGIAVVLLTGLYAGAFVPRLMRVINLGGILTATTQWFPILPMMLGSIAVRIAESLKLGFGAMEEDLNRVPLAGEAGAFLATLIVAAGTIFIAYGTGLLFATLLPPPWTYLPNPEVEYRQNLIERRGVK